MLDEVAVCKALNLNAESMYGALDRLLNQQADIAITFLDQAHAELELNNAVDHRYETVGLTIYRGC